MPLRANHRLAAIIGLAAIVCTTPAVAKKDVFQAPRRNLGVWRLTFDPSVRNWANYHNTQSFSPDGRYVCYIHDSSSGPVSLRVFDLFEDKEIVIGDGVHLHDGVIRREWFDGRVIRRRHDLNGEGKAIRRTEFENGEIVTREYHHRERGLVSRELFDADGFITDWIRFQDVDGEPTEYDHWYFERGMPVRHTNSKGREYVKRGDRWGYYREGEFIDTPRE